MIHKNNVIYIVDMHMSYKFNYDSLDNLAIDLRVIKKLVNQFITKFLYEPLFVL